MAHFDCRCERLIEERRRVCLSRVISYCNKGSNLWNSHAGTRMWNSHAETRNVNFWEEKKCPQTLIHRGGTHFGGGNSCLGEGTPIRAQRLQPLMAGTPLMVSHGAQRCPTPVFSWPGQGGKITLMAGILFCGFFTCPGRPMTESNYTTERYL